MLNEPTLQKLQALQLSAMADALAEQQKSLGASELSFEERFARLVDAEFIARENRRIKRNLARAKLGEVNASLDRVRVDASRGIDTMSVRELRACRWVRDRRNILITGPSGVGKTYVASALGRAACLKGHRVAYLRLPQLFETFAVARAEATYDRVLADLLAHDVVILDDFGGDVLSGAQRHDLLEVLENRGSGAATVIASRLAVDDWYRWLDDPTLADAILDCTIEGALRLLLTSERPNLHS